MARRAPREATEEADLTPEALLRRAGVAPPPPPLIGAELLAYLKQVHADSGLIPLDVGRRATENLPALRMLAHKTLAETIHVCVGIITGDIEAEISERLSAMRVLMELGVPKQIEARPWRGDLHQFDLDELDRIASGEHPDDILADRTRRRLHAERSTLRLPPQIAPDPDLDAPEVEALEPAPLPEETDPT